MIFVCISLGQTVPHQFTLDNPISSINGNAKKPRASFDSVHTPRSKAEPRTNATDITSGPEFAQIHAHPARCFGAQETA